MRYKWMENRLAIVAVAPIAIIAHTVVGAANGFLESLLDIRDAWREVTTVTNGERK